jgi:hypothetical protein
MTWILEAYAYYKCEGEDTLYIDHGNFDHIKAKFEGISKSLPGFDDSPMTGDLYKFEVKLSGMYLSGDSRGIRMYELEPSDLASIKEFMGFDYES